MCHIYVIWPQPEVQNPLPSFSQTSLLCLFSTLPEQLNKLNKSWAAAASLCSSLCKSSSSIQIWLCCCFATWAAISHFFLLVGCCNLMGLVGFGDFQGFGNPIEGQVIFF
uniref:uncharacterized protein LOC101297113 n=1 Tax=Fragaria vesca subsp. vesca TaxID=101020 RepID=UPI0005C7EAAD|nr:PREDICTED: uncharacterized protein LOC101297113 [Fragaria vesca subsp. vesca]